MRKVVWNTAVMLAVSLLLMGGNAFSAWQSKPVPCPMVPPLHQLTGNAEDVLPLNPVTGTESNAAGDVVSFTGDKPESASFRAEAAAQVQLSANTVSPPPAVPVNKEAPTAPFTLGAARDYNLVTRVTVKNTGQATSNNIRLQVPLLSSSSPYQVQSEEEFSLEPQEIQVLQGIRTGVFHLGSLAPGAETTLELRYRVKTSVIRFHSDFLAKAGSSRPEIWLAPTKGVESDHKDIMALSGQITDGSANDWDKAKAITSWVARNISYDAAAPNKNSGALQALKNRKGVCEDFATLSAALARAAGIPARVAYGYADGGTRWPAQGAFSLRGSRHAWVEYYLEGWGWVPAEPTRSRHGTLYFGTLPHNRYIVQNYNDASLRGSYSGGKLTITWNYAIE